MRKFIASLAVALTLGGILTVGVPILEATTDISVIEAVADVESAEAYVAVWYSDCVQSAGYGTRVCFDISENLFKVYTPGLYVQFASNGGSYSGPLGVWSGDEWRDVANTNGTNAWSPSAYTYTSGDACYNSGNRICVYGGNNNFLKWFASYGDYEFVVST